MARNAYHNGTIRHTESLDPKLFKDFKNRINKEYYKRHLAIEYQSQIALLEKSKIWKAVSDSFFTMKMKEQERQLVAFSKGESFVTMEDLKEQERQIEAFSKDDSFITMEELKA